MASKFLWSLADALLMKLTKDGKSLSGTMIRTVTIGDVPFPMYFKIENSLVLDTQACALLWGPGDLGLFALSFDNGERGVALQISLLSLKGLVRGELSNFGKELKSCNAMEDKISAYVVKNFIRRHAGGFWEDVGTDAKDMDFSKARSNSPNYRSELNRF